MALIGGKAAQGTLQAMLRSSCFVMGAGNVAVSSTNGCIQGACDFSGYRHRWRQRYQTDTGFQRNWISAGSDTEVPMPMKVVITYDVNFFVGAL